MPGKGKNKLFFKNCYKELPVPYLIYADSEALTTKIKDSKLDTTKGNIQKIQEQKACGYSCAL